MSVFDNFPHVSHHALRQAPETQPDLTDVGECLLLVILWCEEKDQEQILDRDQ